jgi:hypothetical protein
VFVVKEVLSRERRNHVPKGGKEVINIKWKSEKKLRISIKQQR